MNAYRNRCCRLKSRSIPLALIFYASAQTSLAQCTQQPPNWPYAVPPGSTVYYSIASSVTSLPSLSTATSPTAQITAAFAGWSAANAQSGGDGTTFVQATAINPATVIVNADLTNTGNQVATTSIANIGVINGSNIATITFFPNSAAQGTNTTFFQALQTGYGTAYLEAALHEIGHLQGIGDYNPPTSAPAPGPDTSVVTPFIGINDIGNTYQKTAPTSCDAQQAYSSSKAIVNPIPVTSNELGGRSTPPINTPSPLPPDEGGGSGGSSNCSEYFDASSNTLYEYCS